MKTNIFVRTMDDVPATGTEFVLVETRSQLIGNADYIKVELDLKYIPDRDIAEFLEWERIPAKALQKAKDMAEVLKLIEAAGKSLHESIKRCEDIARRLKKIKTVRVKK